MSKIITKPFDNNACICLKCCGLFKIVGSEGVVGSGQIDALIDFGWGKILFTILK